jgi:2-polyprenyl-3-methyl-5-hydroxy-6-metoxy-1,4-benzoquinol methylase
MLLEKTAVASFDGGARRAARTREFDKCAAIEHVAKGIGYKTPQRYRSRCEFVFKDVPLAGKRVLDVGSGPGSLTLWAALSGAESVVALEPEAEGSVAASISTLQALSSKVGLDDVVKLEVAYLQDASLLRQGPFDVAVLYDVINHLDEAAVPLLPAEDAVKSYVSILGHLRRVLAPGAVVVVADCGRHNLWNQLGMRSPVAPTIEWHKHQQPEVWVEVFRRAGFEFFDLRWSPIHPFGSISSLRAVQYAFSSHFVLRFRVSNPGV